MPYKVKHYRDLNSDTKDFLQVDYWYKPDGTPEQAHITANYELGESVMAEDGTNYIILKDGELSKLGEDIAAFYKGESIKDN